QVQAVPEPGAMGQERSGSPGPGDDPFVLEGPKGFPQRCARHAELGRQLRLWRELAPRTDPPPRDQRQQVLASRARAALRATLGDHAHLLTLASICLTNYPSRQPLVRQSDLTAEPARC